MGDNGGEIILPINAWRELIKKTEATTAQSAPAKQLGEATRALLALCDATFPAKAKLAQELHDKTAAKLKAARKALDAAVRDASLWDGASGLVARREKGDKFFGLVDDALEAIDDYLDRLATARIQVTTKRVILTGVKLGQSAFTLSVPNLTEAERAKLEEELIKLQEELRNKLKEITDLALAAAGKLADVALTALETAIERNPTAFNIDYCRRKLHEARFTRNSADYTELRKKADELGEAWRQAVHIRTLLPT